MEIETPKPAFELPFNVNEEFKKFLEYRNMDFSKMKPSYSGPFYMAFDIPKPGFPNPIRVGVSQFKKVSIHTAFSAFHLFEHRKNWEKANTKEAKVLQMLDEVSDIVYIHTSVSILETF